MFTPARRALLALAGLVLLLGGARAAWAADLQFPPLTGRVVDAAHVLTPEVTQEIEQRSRQLEQQTGRQLVVATVPSLQGDDIQDYGYQLGRAWKIGRAGKNDGAILLVAPNEKKVGVEVGYGLEPVLTDALSSVILHTRVLPKFRAGDIAAGVQAGADAIAEQLALPDDQAKANVDQAGQQPTQAQSSGGGGGGGGFSGGGRHRRAARPAGRPGQGERRPGWSAAHPGAVERRRPRRVGDRGPVRVVLRVLGHLRPAAPAFRGRRHGLAALGGAGEPRLPRRA